MTIAASKADMSRGAGAGIYPPSDFVNVECGSSSENTPMVGEDLKRLNELKELSKKIEKDLEEIKKQGKEIEKKIIQKEVKPPQFCFFFSLRTGAIIIGVASLMIFSLSFFVIGAQIEGEMHRSHEYEKDLREAQSAKSSSYYIYQPSHQFRDRVWRTMPPVILATFAANLLLFSIFMKHKGCLLNYLVLTVFVLNWFLVAFITERVYPNANEGFLTFYGFLSVFKAFALYNVYRFYNTLD